MIQQKKRETISFNLVQNAASKELHKCNLQESKTSLEEAQRIAHVGSWVWDLEKNHVTYSDEYYRIFGLTPAKGPIDIATVREMIRCGHQF